MLNQLAEKCADIAASKGWDEEYRSFGDIIALIHSELSEALEEYRDAYSVDVVYYEHKHPDGSGRTVKTPNREMFWPNSTGLSSSSSSDTTTGKPAGVPIEFADVLIRVLHYCHRAGIDIDEAMREKMLYNATRPHRHGGKAI